MSSSAAPAVIAQPDAGLRAHPVIDEMARDLLNATPATLATLVSNAGAPTALFMKLAIDRFRERTGWNGLVLGSVARAVLARLAELRAAQEREREVLAAELEARQAIRDMWRHGYPRSPLTKYADTSGALADWLAVNS